MKSFLFALTLAASASCFAHADEAVATVDALKSECAASYAAKLDAKSSGASNEYHFVYAKGEFKGEAQPGMNLACTEGQYAAYLDKQDPTRVMAAYPSAAGRPTAKDAKK